VSKEKRFQMGFTLVELMVVVAIIGILASVAYPAYIEHVRKARRADAQAALTQAAQFMERSYSLSQKYSGVSLPSSIGAAQYAISISAQSDTAFTLQAAPASGWSDPKCGTLSLDNAGVKTPTTPGCW